MGSSIGKLLCRQSTVLAIYVYARPLAYGHCFAVRAHHYLTVCFCFFLEVD